MVATPACPTVTFWPPIRMMADRGMSGFAATARFTTAGPVPNGSPETPIQLGRLSTAHGQYAPAPRFTATVPPALATGTVAGVGAMAHVVPAGESTATRWPAGSAT